MGRNKILSSPHYAEIHQRLARGDRIKDVEEWYNGLDDIPCTISGRTFSRYLSKYINQVDKVQAKYNQRKAEEREKKNIPIAKRNADELLEKSVEEALVVNEATDAFVESRVDELEIIDELTSRLYDNIQVSEMNDYQKGQLLVNLINTKSKMIGPEVTGVISDVNVFNLFSEDDGDILDDVRDTDE